MQGVGDERGRPTVQEPQRSRWPRAAPTRRAPGGCRVNTLLLVARSHSGWRCSSRL